MPQPRPRSGIIIGLLSLGLLVVVALMAGPAQAQTTSPGPYYAMPSWDQTLPSATRFIILSNFAGAAVLDRETGLVWEKAPRITGSTWNDARSICIDKTIGNRKGWRLPSVHELASLIEPAASASSLALPAGHPFTVQVGFFWSATTFAEDSTLAWFVSILNGSANATFKASSGTGVWCVRGAMNAEAY